MSVSALWELLLPEIDVAIPAMSEVREWANARAEQLRCDQAVEAGAGVVADVVDVAVAWVEAS